MDNSAMQKALANYFNQLHSEWLHYSSIDAPAQQGGNAIIQQPLVDHPGEQGANTFFPPWQIDHPGEIGANAQMRSDLDFPDFVPPKLKGVK